MFIGKDNQFISFKSGYIQLLDIFNCLGAATNLDSFSKVSETKGYFPFEWFNDPEKLKSTQLPPYETFFSKLRNNNPLKEDYWDFSKFNRCGLDI